MAEQSYKPGDIVQLKSGGPKMTVVNPDFHISTSGVKEVKCQWFAGSNLKFGYFELTSLKAIE